MKRLGTLTAAVTLLLPTVAGAKPTPDVCHKGGIVKSLKDYGKPTGVGISALACADVTGDGQSDAVFTVASGGPRGSTHFGVLEGPAGSLLLFKSGVHVAIDVTGTRRFDVQRPVYEEGDGAPISYTFRAYRFAGDSFAAGKAHSYPNAKARFSE